MNWISYRTCLRSAGVEAVEDGLADLRVGAELLEALGGHPDAVGQRLHVRLRGDDDGDGPLSAIGKEEIITWPNVVNLVNPTCTDRRRRKCSPPRSAS